MRKAITIAIVIAMAVPAITVAQTYNWYDYTKETPLLDEVLYGISIDSITFSQSTYETGFLNAAQAFETARNACNYSSCVSYAQSMERFAQYITDSDRRNAVEEVTEALQTIYSYSASAFEASCIDPDDEDGLGDRLYATPKGTLTIRITIEHCDTCDTRFFKHQEEACRHRLRIGIEFE
ncbi:hypothetical protein GF359_09865 [candidate division WOR-3 bacterium]|uniref:Uncharacterized protein n=1 Tax=candidate division WOR-3 bacterium TaxID=2052148 RepID=A0A9D5KAQ6_UNCW3|nr:hypothetical protein [candidate division WOR-3 bacterium]MBD3365506.1 hypothetical protein [candidate division WOR-3 bacterium]